MDFTIKESKSPLKEGEHLAKFVGYTLAEPKPGFKDGVCWEFEIVRGECAGRKAKRITPLPPSSKNACGQILQQLTGCELKDGVTADVDACIGKLYRITVTKSPGGYPIVKECIRHST